MILMEHPAYLWAGGPSMMMLIQSICIALRGFGSPNTVERVISDSAAMLLQEEAMSTVGGASGVGGATGVKWAGPQDGVGGVTVVLTCSAGT